MYNSASTQLNMNSLLCFLQELVFQSRKQLITCQTKHKNKTNKDDPIHPEEIIQHPMSFYILLNDFFMYENNDCLRDQVLMIEYYYIEEKLYKIIYFFFTACFTLSL